MPMMSPKSARATFADLTANCALPLDPDVLLRTDLLHHHGHTVIGDAALRGYKYKGRWRYDERDVRRAGRALAELPINLDDLAEIHLPEYRDHIGLEEWARPDWRRQLVTWMFNAARHKAFQEDRPYDENWDSWKEIGDNGLPGGLTMTEFIQARSNDSHMQNIAGTKPRRLLSWSGEHWLLPRAYADLLDRWERLEDDLVNQARICSSCGTKGPLWAWRTPTANGYITLCPPCSGTAYQTYQGHLHGVLYESLRRTMRADDYLCRLCAQSRAFTWDHCHDHGYVRGPLCASCNTFEGKGVRFLLREGSVLHLLECRGCLEQKTLPRRFRIAVIREHVEATERHGRCRHRPYTQGLEHVHDVHRFSLRCHQSSWTKDVTATEAADVVRAFVEKALAAARRAD
ncbi:endonuclease domain-containing protein [Streptomyces sp. CT34]|uniref:endonuclease domain-containing protein n=1 Tax=Streptomyces sp. CT34 TaxID=1553907 RepID=UPI0005BD1F1B|nr:endonuclease domain-containing protein [Streptomyces sp. CT34]